LVGGVFLPCQEFGPGMVARGKGSIINIASVSAHIPLSRVVTYSASKAAVLNLTIFLAREWAPKGVRVNSITPGFFPAEQNGKIAHHAARPAHGGSEGDGGPHPRGPFGRAEEIGGGGRFPGEQRRQLCPRDRYWGGWRIPGPDDLRAAAGRPPGGCVRRPACE